MERPVSESEYSQLVASELELFLQKRGVRLEVRQMIVVVPLPPELMEVPKPAPPSVAEAGEPPKRKET